MRIEYKENLLDALQDAAFFQQVKAARTGSPPPTLRAKKYDEGNDVWQARVNRDWRFYFRIVGGAYVIHDVVPHPK